MVKHIIQQTFYFFLGGGGPLVGSPLFQTYIRLVIEIVWSSLWSSGLSEAADAKLPKLSIPVAQMTYWTTKWSNSSEIGYTLQEIKVVSSCAYPIVEDSKQPQQEVTSETPVYFVYVPRIVRESIFCNTQWHPAGDITIMAAIMFTMKGSSITEAETIATKHLCYKHANKHQPCVRINEVNQCLCNVQKNRGYGEWLACRFRLWRS